MAMGKNNQFLEKFRILTLNVKILREDFCNFYRMFDLKETTYLLIIKT